MFTKTKGDGSNDDLKSIKKNYIQMLQTTLLFFI